MSGYSTSYGTCKSGRCGCGKLGEPCCPTSSFTTGTGCSTYDLACASASMTGLPSSTCQACGKVGGPCCANSTCTDPGAQCLLGTTSTYTCKVCGGTNQPCCTTGTACKDAGTVCDSSSSLCKACGVAGGPCCANYTCKDSSMICKNSICSLCGTDGAPCCGGNTCTSGCCVSRFGSTYSPICVGSSKVCDSYGTSTGVNPTCSASEGGSCTGGTTNCGGLNQACCVSTYSSSTSYLYCGGSGTRCLSTTSGTATQYTCTACGDKGQRCCYDTTSSTSSYGVPCKSPYVCASVYNSSTGTYTYTCGTSTSTTTGVLTD